MSKGSKDGHASIKKKVALITMVAQSWAGVQVGPSQGRRAAGSLFFCVKITREAFFLSPLLLSLTFLAGKCVMGPPPN